jgi:alpha-ribazole phosphatase/probable phosphoglycerate mutase
MLTIYLLRHGETEWNADGNRYCGRTDLPLTEKGIAQAKLVRDELKNIHFDAIFSSPLKRAFHTAEIVSGREDVIADERLTELDFGSWEGKSKTVFIPENKTLWHEWMNDPENTKAGGTGETAGEALKRVNSFYDSITKKFLSGNILVVAHHAVNRFYLASKLGMPLKNYRKLDQKNSSVTLFTLGENEEFVLQAFNLFFHL